CAPDPAVGLRPARRRRLLLLDVRHHHAGRNRPAGLFLAQRLDDDVAFSPLPEFLSRAAVSAGKADRDAARLLAWTRRPGLYERARPPLNAGSSFVQRRHHWQAGSDRRAEFPRPRRYLGLR